MINISNYNFKNKKAIVRVDFNVPLDSNFNVTDNTRIVAALPTIKKIISDGGAAVLMSHLGRPKGVEPNLSLKHVVAELSKQLGVDVKFVDDCIGDKVIEAKKTLKNGEVLLLENLRFYKQENKDKEGMTDFAKQLSQGCDVYVNDAFGTAHRAHASTAVIAQFLPDKMAGFLLEKEIKFLGQTVANPEKPFVAIVGGAKVSGKLEVLQSLIEKTNTILIGGGMAYTFLKAQGHKIGNSLVENDLIDTAKQILQKAEKQNVKFMLPIDHVVADKFDNNATIKNVDAEIPEGYMALDIGKKTIELYSAEISNAKTIVWNGPMGCFEMSNFANGTFEICKAVANANAVSIIGGGDSVAAVNQSGLASKMTHISTGGGASLEFLEGKQLPGIVAVQ